MFDRALSPSPLNRRVVGAGRRKIENWDGFGIILLHDSIVYTMCGGDVISHGLRWCIVGNRTAVLL